MKLSPSHLNRFPDLNDLYKLDHPSGEVDPSGLLAYGGDFKVETLFEAYFKGIFPWPEGPYTYLWFSPPERGVLDFDEIHIPRSLQKLIDKNPYTFTINENFKEVVLNCAEKKRKHQKGTWIIPEIIEAYLEFHDAGFAKSLECWKDNELVGGIYGVCVEGVFSGESMFGKEDNVSKLCLYQLIQHLKSKGFEWMDIQMVTDVTGRLGGQYIPRKKFLDRLKLAHKNPKSF